MKLSEIKSKIKDISNQELSSLHYRVHQLYSIASKRNSEDIKTSLRLTHSIIVKEMERRNLRHNSPILEMTLTESLIYNILSEAYKQSMIKRGRPQKLESSAGAIAVRIARQRHDPLYDRMIKFKRMYRDAKERLEKKYWSIAMQKARQMSSKAK